TQFAAVALNVLAGAGALALTRRSRAASTSRVRREVARTTTAIAPHGISPAIAWICAALALSGFAAMGLEIVWLRHFTLLLGSFRSVFSLLLTIVLAGIGAGALAAGSLSRRVASPERALMIVQALLVVFALAGLAANSFDAINAARRRQIGRA